MHSRPRRASPPTGSTRKAASATSATSATSSGCGSCSSGSRKCAIRRSSSATSRSTSIPEEVYIFTPKGEVKSLPRGATPVDFAYAIHTDVGHRCVGARVNGKMVPLRTRLKNGDIVEIVTQAEPHAEPRLAELRGDVARAQQDPALRPGGGESAQRRARTQAVREGGAPFRPQPEDAAWTTEAFAKVADEYGGGKAEELLAAIGYGKLPPRTVLAQARAGRTSCRRRRPDGRVVSRRQARAAARARTGSR